MRPHSRRSAPLTAALLLTCAATLFAIMDGIGKSLTDVHSVAQIVWARYAFAVPVVLAAAGPTRWRDLLACERPVLQGLRALLPLLASVSVIVGLILMPLADFTAIGFVSPLIVVALSAPLLREKVTALTWLGVLCGFVGVLVIVRPGIGTVSWAAVFPLFTALSFALYQVLTRIVSRGDEPIVTLAWTIVVGLVVTSAVVPFQWQPVSAWSVALLVASGLLFGLAHFLVIRAYGMAPAAFLAPFTYAQIVAATIIGALAFGHIPDIWTMAGSGIIVVAGLGVLRSPRAP